MPALLQLIDEREIAEGDPAAGRSDERQGPTGHGGGKFGA